MKLKPNIKSIPLNIDDLDLDLDFTFNIDIPVIQQKADVFYVYKKESNNSLF